MQITEKEILKLVKVMLETDDLSRISEVVSEILGNPIVVFDTSYRVLSYSTLSKLNDPVWISTIHRGFWSYEFISYLNSTQAKEKNGKDYFIFNGKSGGSPLRRRLGRLELCGVLIGYFVVLEAENHLERIDDESYALVASLLAKEIAFHKNMRVNNHTKHYEGLLSDLLDGTFTSRVYYYNQIQGSELDRNTTFVVFAVNTDNYYPQNPFADDMKETLAGLIPHSWSIFHKEYLVLLVDIGEKKEYKNFLTLQQFLRQNHVIAGCSDPFQDLYQLPAYFWQAQQAIRWAKVLKKEELISYYDDYKLFQLIKDANKKEQLLRYCTVQVAAIQQYDAANRTEYLKTLFFYLQNRQSIQATADCLFVHRNTVTYRLERIRERFHVDFRDEHVNVQNYLSCLLFLHQKELYEL